MRVTQRESSDEIDRAAALWAVRLDHGRLDGEQEAALSNWLSGDRRRSGALLRAQATLLHFDRVQGLGPNGMAVLRGERNRRVGLSRRLMIGGSAAALAATVLGVVSSRLPQRTPSLDYSTGRGEIRSIALADGSTITLDAMSGVQVAMRADRRNVVLGAGRALFDVAHDPARPFVVEAGDILVRAVGTSFSVDRRSDGALQILMREGLVRVTKRSDATFRRELAAWHMLTVLPNGAAQASIEDDAAVERTLAWRESMVELDGETLKVAAARFARYSDYQIVLDPAVEEMRVTGRYSAADARGFALAAAASLDIRITVGVASARLFP